MKRMFVCLFVVCYTLGAMAGSDPDREEHFIKLAPDYQATMGTMKKQLSDVVMQYNNAVKGLDGCTENGKYANQFTIDRRCYITDEQRQKPPYNAVVGINNAKFSDYETFQSYSNGNVCTGVIIKNPLDGQLYIYTAAHCVSSRHTYAYTQKGDVIPVTSVVKQGGGATEFETKDHAVLAVPQEYQNVLPYVGTGEYTDNKVDVVGHGTLSILNDSAIHAAKQQWTQILKNPPKTTKTVLEQIKYYQEYTDFCPTDAKLKVSHNCELLQDNSQNRSNLSKHNYCQIYGGNSGGPIFDVSGKVIGIVSWKHTNKHTDTIYNWLSYEGMKDVADLNKDLQKHQEISKKEPQNIRNLEQVGGFNPYQKHYDK